LRFRHFVADLRDVIPVFDALAFGGERHGVFAHDIRGPQAGEADAAGGAHAFGRFVRPINTAALGVERKLLILFGAFERCATIVCPDFVRAQVNMGAETVARLIMSLVLLWGKISLRSLRRPEEMAETSRPVPPARRLVTPGRPMLRSLVGDGGGARQKKDAQAHSAGEKTPTNGVI